MKQDDIRKEIEKIRNECGGTIPNGAIIERAQAEEHPLHSYFEWDDSEAAHQYRLEQERRLIRVCVIIPESTTSPVRAYVSIVEDRGTEGYRHIHEVMSSDHYRKQLLEQSFREFSRFEQKYAVLSEWSEVFQIARGVKRG